MRINLDHAHSFAYVVDDLIVVEFRLAFGWTTSPEYPGAPAEAAALSHCSTSPNSMGYLRAREGEDEARSDRS